MFLNYADISPQPSYNVYCTRCKNTADSCRPLTLSVYTHTHMRLDCHSTRKKKALNNKKRKMKKRTEAMTDRIKREMENIKTKAKVEMKKREEKESKRYS